MDKDFWGKLERAVAQSADMNVAQSGGGFIPAAAGIAQARFISYIEMGKHVESVQGYDVARDKVWLVFELSGPNHSPRDGANGEKVPQRITVKETLSLNADDNFFKLFRAMNYAGKARHMAQLLGAPFLVEIFHKKSEDGKQTFANLKGPNGYNVCGPFYQDLESGKTIAVKVPPAMSLFRYFIWDAADKERWDSIYIEGEYEVRTDTDGKVIAPAKSKNLYQEYIMQATNWPELAERLGL